MTYQQQTRPSDVPSERKLLGCMLFDADAIDTVVPLLIPDDFSTARHGEIFKHIIELHNSGEFVTEAGVHHAMSKGWGTTDEENLYRYLHSLTQDQVFFPHEAEIYAKNILQTAKRWALMGHGSTTVQDAYNDTDADAVLERAEQRLFEIGKRGRQNEYTSLATLSATYSEKFEVMQAQRGAIPGIPTGFRDLDFFLGGLQATDFITLAARPGMGKTAWALSVADYAAFHEDKKVAFYSLEMGKEQLFQRLLAKKAEVNSQALRVPWSLGSDDKERVRWAMNELAKKASNFFIDDTQAISTMELRSKSRRLRAKYGIDLLIVDYLQLMQAVRSDGKRIEDRRIEVDEISRFLKSLAIELNIPVLALAQLSRAVESRQVKVPQLSDLREAGGIEQDSDIVLFIYRDEIYNADTLRKNEADLIIAKHRNGPVGEVTLWFDPQFTRFRNMEMKVIQ